MTSNYPMLALAFATLTVAPTSVVVVVNEVTSARVHPPASLRSVHQAPFRRTAAGGFVYVSNANQQFAPFVGSVLIYPVGSNGNMAPAASITGSNTLLTQVNGIVVDNGGEIYVANSDTNSIVGFAAGSNGNVRPNIVISGSKTGLASPLALALDQAGNLYVANCGLCNYGPSGATSVEEFAAGSNGNVAPIRAISGKRTQMGTIEGLALDEAGFIYVANSFTAEVTVYGPRSKGDAAPKRALLGLNVPVGLAVSRKSLFVTAVTAGEIERFSHKAVGDAYPRSKFKIDWPANPSGQSLAGIAAAPDGSIYVAGFSAPLVAQYAHDAKRRPRPLSVISGPNTQLTLPTFVYVK